MHYLTLKCLNKNPHFRINILLFISKKCVGSFFERISAAKILSKIDLNKLDFFIMCLKLIYSR